MDRAIRLSPYSPRWYHIIPFMEYYMREEYELALSEALQINAPTLFLGSSASRRGIRALGASRRSQGRLCGIAAYSARLCGSSRAAFARPVFSDSMLKKVLSGLRAAGLLPPIV